MSIKTKQEWEKAVEKKREELRKTPTMTYLPVGPCNHDTGQYGNCTCGTENYPNWEYTRCERELKQLLTDYYFCPADGRRLKPSYDFCPSCGGAARRPVVTHARCSNWNPQLRFCPDCGLTSGPV